MVFSVGIDRHATFCRRERSTVQTPEAFPRSPGVQHDHPAIGSQKAIIACVRTSRLELVVLLGTNDLLKQVLQCMAFRCLQVIQVRELPFPLRRQ